MHNCLNSEVSMGKKDKLNKNQCPKNNLKKQSMQHKPYASLANLGEQHWKAAKKVMRYLQRTKSFMLVYKRVDNLELLGYTGADFARCVDDQRSISGYIFFLSGGVVSWRSQTENPSNIHNAT